MLRLPYLDPGFLKKGREHNENFQSGQVNNNQIWKIRVLTKYRELGKKYDVQYLDLFP